MSYPSRLKEFKAWAKAMEEGATVDKPRYSQTATYKGRASGRSFPKKRRRWRNARRRKAKKKEG